MKKQFFLSIMGGFAIFAFVASSASATHSWGGYHWARKTNPFTLKVGDNMTSTWDPYLDTAISDWSVSTVLDVTKTVGLTTAKTCRATTGRDEACNARYGNNGWLGIAQIWITGDGHITKGTVKMNDTYFNTATYNTPAWRQLVVCQELAHTFGLDHQDENFNNPPLGTCMDYTNDPTPNQHPNQHDFDELQIIYSHLDAVNTVAQSAAQGSAQTIGESDGEGTWGESRKHDGHNRISHFERQVNQNEKLMTFVVWAE